MMTNPSTAQNPSANPPSAWHPMLRAEYGVTMTMDAVAFVLKRAKGGIMSSIYSGEFPIPTFRAGMHRLAKTDDVASYLAQCEMSQ